MHQRVALPHPAVAQVPDAQNQYTEKLVRFKSLGVYFYPPNASPAHANGAAATIIGLSH